MFGEPALGCPLLQVVGAVTGQPRVGQFSMLEPLGYPRSTVISGRQVTAAN